MASESHEIAFIDALKSDWQRINAGHNQIASLISGRASKAFPKFADDPSGIFAKIVGHTFRKEDIEAANKIHDQLGTGNSVETTITIQDRKEGQASFYLTIVTNGRHLNL